MLTSQAAAQGRGKRSGVRMLRSVTLGVALALAASAAAVAQSSEDEAACKDDAFRVCGQTIPDREQTFQCMIANRDVLSAACRAVIARSLPPEPAPQKVRRAKKGKDKGPVNLSPTAAR
jgi:hypothetical protein